MVTESNIRAVPALIGQLYEIVRRLNGLFPRPFTPDGHLVGSIGEVVAAHVYGLHLEECSNRGFDATTQSNNTVEIKLTGGDAVSVSGDCEPLPDFLIVLKLNPEIGFTEIYNGEFPNDLWGRKVANKRGVKSFRVKELMDRRPTRALVQKNSLAEFNQLFTVPERS